MPFHSASRASACDFFMQEKGAGAPAGKDAVKPGAKPKPSARDFHTSIWSNAGPSDSPPDSPEQKKGVPTDPDIAPPKVDDARQQTPSNKKTNELVGSCCYHLFLSVMPIAYSQAAVCLCLLLIAHKFSNGKIANLKLTYTNRTGTGFDLRSRYCCSCLSLQNFDIGTAAAAAAANNALAEANPPQMITCRQRLCMP